jgi:hypothetical protein
MEIQVERAHPAEEIGPLQPSHLWILGLAVGDDGALAGPGHRRSSYWAECECPDDCLRDHENE